MKRSLSYDDLEEAKKRKRNNLTIKNVELLKCDICGEDVYDYKKCTGQYIYCSLNCLEILFLRYLNNIQYESFDDEHMDIDI